MPSRTRWGLALLLIFAGVVAAFQVGKAAIAVPVLQRELSLSLAAAAWIVGIYATLGATLGLPAGILASVVSARRALVAGLALIGAASMAGAFATSAAPLLISRMAEGCGFLAVVLSVPRLLRPLIAPRDSQIAFACWGAYMPGGSAAMMLAGPALLSAFGWQGLWLGNGALALVYAAVAWRATAGLDPREQAARPERSALVANVADVLRTPAPVLMGALFCVYTFQYFALTGLMPTLLVDRMGLSIAAAGFLSALTVVANTLGNLSAGIILRLGVPLWAVAVAAFCFLGAAGFGIFSNALPAVAIAGLAAVSLALTGIVPASIWATLPYSVSGSARLAIALGLMIQASNLGQFLGPSSLGAFVERYGWDNAPLLFVCIVVTGVTIALALRRAMVRTTATSP
jgi:predicted MFS family arabinose efflux permease